MNRNATDKVAFLLCVAFIGFYVMCSPHLASAQVTTGTIIGEAKDSADAILPGVKVTVKNVRTGLVREVETRLSVFSLKVAALQVSSLGSFSLLH